MENDIGGEDHALLGYIDGDAAGRMAGDMEEPDRMLAQVEGHPLRESGVGKTHPIPLHEGQAPGVYVLDRLHDYVPRHLCQLLPYLLVGDEHDREEMTGLPVV